MIDLRITSRKENQYIPGTLDIKFDNNGNLDTIDDAEKIYIQNLMKAILDKYREIGYGVDLGSFKGTKYLDIIRLIIQSRIVDTIAFMNRYYPVEFKLITSTVELTEQGLFVRIVLDRNTLEVYL